MPGKFGKLTLHREAVAFCDGLAMQGELTELPGH